MHKESLCGNRSTNSYLKVCDLQSAFNSSDSVLKIKTTHTHTHVNTFTHTYSKTSATNCPGNAFLRTLKLKPHHQIYTSVKFSFFIKSHYSQITYWILNIVFTLRLIEAFCFQTVSCNIFKQRKCSAIHCLQPESVISTTTEMETMPSMQMEFRSKLLSLFLLGSFGLGVILGQEIAKDQIMIIPYSCWKPPQNKGNPQK